MSQTAFNKYGLNTITAGDITTESVAITYNNGADVPFLLHYNRVGKLYFGFYATDDAGGGSQGDIVWNIGRRAAIGDPYPLADLLTGIEGALGITINTSYLTPVAATTLNGNFYPLTWSPGIGKWIECNPGGGFVGQALEAILAN